MINIQNRQPLSSVSFKGAVDGALTNTLRVLDTNPMVNAVGIDLFAMVGPRTYVDTKERNKYAGAETFFREFTGTLIVCLSASYFAKGIAKIANKIINPNTKINTKSWFSNDSIAVLQEANKKTVKTSEYVENILNGISGFDKNETVFFKDINPQNIEWVNEQKWEKYTWNNREFENIHNKIKSKNDFVNLITELIDNKQISNSDSKQLKNILEFKMTNALGADKITVNISGKKLASTIHNILRDTIDMGKDVFTNPNIDTQKAINKILKINKIKSVGALVLASSLGLSNQYINRKITEKRTGTKGFVGDSNYKNQLLAKKSSKDTSKKFMLEKVIASLGMAIMALKVMKIKSLPDFFKKLEFTGPVTGGNAIKTVYASTLIGRFMASDNKDELRETVTRDYFGFLNWLVLGGFAAKAAANVLDPEKKNLFNISKEGKGLKHWLNDLSLKSHNEIFAKGTKFAKHNMWKLNAAHIAGLAYSTTALGILLPKLNIYITNKLSKQNNSNKFRELGIQRQNISMQGFMEKSL